LNLFRISDFDIRISSEQEFSFKHYLYIQDTCQVHPILFVINDGHGVSIQRRFRIGTNRNTSPHIDSRSQPGHLPTGPATGWPLSPAIPHTENPLLTELNSRIMIKAIC